jgi:hypothetical protein
VRKDAPRRLGYLPWKAYLADRHVGALTLVRILLCASVLGIPALVPIPINAAPLPLAMFLPLAFAVPQAASLPERLAWLSVGRGVRRLRRLRCVTVLAADALAIAVSAVGLHAAGESLGLLGAALLALGLSYATAVASSSQAWLVAAFLGTIGLVSVGGSSVTLAAVVPLPLGILVWVVAGALVCVAGSGHSGKAS